jgi:hypothetical protein
MITEMKAAMSGESLRQATSLMKELHITCSIPHKFACVSFNFYPPSGYDFFILHDHPQIYNISKGTLPGTATSNELRFIIEIYLASGDITINIGDFNASLFVILAYKESVTEIKGNRLKITPGSIGDITNRRVLTRLHKTSSTEERRRTISPYDEASLRTISPYDETTDTTVFGELNIQ